MSNSDWRILLLLSYLLHALSRFPMLWPCVGPCCLEIWWCTRNVGRTLCTRSSCNGTVQVYLKYYSYSRIIGAAGNDSNAMGSYLTVTGARPRSTPTPTCVSPCMQHAEQIFPIANRLVPGDSTEQANRNYLAPAAAAAPFLIDRDRHRPRHRFPVDEIGQTMRCARVCLTRRANCGDLATLLLLKPYQLIH